MLPTTSTVTLFLLPMLATIYGLSDNCDKLGVLLYEDIGCLPVKNAEETCPSRYDCNLNRPKSGCIFKAKNFSPGEDIESDLTYSGCSIGCRCEDFNFIRCAVLDCPENLGGYGPNFENCYYEYELDKCCSIGQKCLNETVLEPKQCKVDGAVYNIGARFYPKNTCLSCVCHENFTEGVYDEQTCSRQNCVAQVHFTEEINRKCAPAYFNFHSDEVLCCPNDFICPDADLDTILMVNHEADTNSTLECDYGEEKLKLGEGFKRSINKYGKDRDIQCECVLPPLVTCREI